MAADLIVGPLDSDIEDRVLRIWRRLGLRNWPPTDSPIGLNPRMTTSSAQHMTENVMISVLNNASLDAFNTFAAGLEVFLEHDAMTKTALRNLPWWLQFFWLPIEFDPPKELDSDQGDPTFVGSSIRLLNELTKIEMSLLDVSTTPPTYDDMRNDYRSWFSISHRRSEDDAIDGFGTRFVMVRRFQSRGNFR
jgi:hypothetical protein